MVHIAGVQKIRVAVPLTWVQLEGKSWIEDYATFNGILLPSKVVPWTTQPEKLPIR